MYGEAYWCPRCLTEIGTWRPDYDSHDPYCWLRVPYKKDPRLGGYEGMQRLFDYWAGRAALGYPYVYVTERVLGEVGWSPAGTSPPEPTGPLSGQQGGS